MSVCGRFSPSRCYRNTYTASLVKLSNLHILFFKCCINNCVKKKKKKMKHVFKKHVFHNIVKHVLLLFFVIKIRFIFSVGILSTDNYCLLLNHYYFIQ